MRHAGTDGVASDGDLVVAHAVGPGSQGVRETASAVSTIRVSALRGCAEPL